VSLWCFLVNPPVPAPDPVQPVEQPGAIHHLDLKDYEVEQDPAAKKQRKSDVFPRPSAPIVKPGPGRQPGPRASLPGAKPPVKRPGLRPVCPEDGELGTARLTLGYGGAGDPVPRSNNPDAAQRAEPPRHFPPEAGATRQLLQSPDQDATSFAAVSTPGGGWFWWARSHDDGFNNGAAANPNTQHSCAAASFHSQPPPCTYLNMSLC
jgi:hypothetical protein